MQHRSRRAVADRRGRAYSSAPHDLGAAQRTLRGLSATVLRPADRALREGFEVGTVWRISSREHPVDQLVVNVIARNTVVRQRFFWIPATDTDIISAHYFWTGGLKPGCYDAVAIARAAGFPNAGYESHPSCRDIVGAVVGIVPLSVFRSIGMINLAGV